MMVSVWNVWNAPSRERSSLTNPLSPGRPAEPKAKKRRNPAMIGSGVASELMSAICRVRVRSYR